MQRRTAAMAISAVLSTCLLTTSAWASLSGPVFPAPGGTTFSSTGTSSGGSGGSTLNYSAIQVGTFTSLYWAPQAGSVQLTLTGSAPVTLNYDPTTSNLPGGVARWTASGVAYTNPNPGTQQGPLNVRFTITQASPSTSALVAAPPDISAVGAAENVIPTAGAFSLNVLFEAQYPPGSGTWVPVDTLPQPAGTSNNVQTDFSGGFYYQLAQRAPALGLTGAVGLTLLLSAVGVAALRRRTLAV
jgi:hypothetical protein